MKLMSCNIRTSLASDGDNAWVHRRDLCARVIRSRAPDLVGFQEMNVDQYEDLAAALPGYDSFATVDEPVGNRPQNAVFYRRECFRRISAGGYWLSKTPHVPGSRSWDSACVRLANWVRLLDHRNGCEFRFVNTHLDHVSQAAREGQAGLLNEDAAAYPGDFPQILSGDMNADGVNPAIALLKAGGWIDTHAAIHGPADPGITFHAFQGRAYNASPDGKIDWIFTRGKVRATAAEIVKDADRERFPSDHYFLAVELAF